MRINWLPSDFIPPGDWVVHKIGGASKFIDGAWRTARWDNGWVGLPNVSGLYQRWLSAETFKPPYRMHCDILVTARPDTVWIESENRAPHWEWGVCLYPWASAVDPWRDNVVMVTERNTTVPVATQRDRGYSTNWDVGNYQRYVFPRNQWVKVVLDVRSPSQFTMFADGKQIVNAREYSPTFVNQPGRIGFRVDFYDLSIRNVEVFTDEPEPMDIMYQPITPRRVLDTRATRKPKANEVLTVNSGRQCKAAHVNITVVDSGGPGWLAAWAQGGMPESSVLNTFARGQTVANAVNVPTAADGSFKVYTSAGDHIIVDVLGYYP